MAITVFPRLGNQHGGKGYRRLRRGHWSTEGLRCLCAARDGRLYSMFPESYPGASGTSTGHGSGGMNLAFAQPMQVLHGAKMPTVRATALIVMTHASGGGFSAFGTDDSSRLGAHIPWSDGNIYFEWANQEINAGVHSATDRQHAWAFTAGPSGFGIYKDAVRIGGSATAANTRTNGSNLLHINGGQGTGGYNNQICEFFAILDATWNAAQVLEWAVNPWLMFEGSSLLSMTGTITGAPFSPFLVGD